MVLFNPGFLFLEFNMRTKAVILFFPFAVFLFETASFVPVLVEKCTKAASKKSSCTKPEPQDACSKKNAKPSCKPEKKQDYGNKDDDSKNCENNPDCRTCPVCYTFIFQSLYEWPARSFRPGKDYALMNTGCISFYISSVWKPPNGLL